MVFYIKNGLKFNNTVNMENNLILKIVLNIFKIYIAM